MTGRVCVALVLATMLAWAGAWELRVDASGGPADLEERVRSALAAWTDAGVALDAVDRTVVVRYADEALMGPDALTLVVTGGGPGVDLEVLVRPGGERLDEALLVALGIALGGTPGAGALAARLEPGVERRVVAADAAALRRDGVPGDIVGDGRVGFADLLELASQWGRSGVNLPADLDGDGTVGIEDVERLRPSYAFRDLTLGPDEGDAPSDDGDAGDAPSDGDESADGGEVPGESDAQGNDDGAE